MTCKIDKNVDNDELLEDLMIKGVEMDVTEVVYGRGRCSGQGDNDL
jgi:hypothetical protein